MSKFNRGLLSVIGSIWLREINVQDRNHTFGVLNLSLSHYKVPLVDWGLPSLAEFIPCCSGFGFLCGVLSLIVLSLFFWSWCCLSFLDFRLLVAPLLSCQLDQNRTFPYRWCTIRTPLVFGGCVIQALVFRVVWYRPLLCPFFFWPLCCLPLFDFRLLVAPLAIKPEMF